MISSLILLSAAGVFATPVFISEVKASREAGHLRVEVRADGGIDPEGARTVIDDGRLIIYLGGARVRADNRSWELQDGAGEIRAHRHKKETELVVPLTGNGCAGPVELTGSDTGITALVGCEGSVTAKMPAAAKTETTPVTAVKRTGAQSPPVEKRELASAKITASAPPKKLTLKALVELPDEDAPAVAPALSATAPKEATVPAAVPAVAPVRAAVSRAEPIIDRVAAATPVAAAEPVRVVAPLDHESKVAPAAGPVALVVPAVETALPGSGAVPAAASAGTFRSVLFPALLLGALAVAAYLVARRRRGTIHRHIEILETASLGPKRSLVVARIGDDTFVLGSSEAGITLLRGSPSALPPALAAELVTQVGPSLVPAAAATAPASSKASGVGPDAFRGVETDQPIEEALADIPEPDGFRGGQARPGFRAIEGGLAGLFGKRGGTWHREVATPPVFDDLLEDSIEDQELRRKLAAGLSSRVR